MFSGNALAVTIQFIGAVNAGLFDLCIPVPFHAGNDVRTRLQWRKGQSISQGSIRVVSGIVDYCGSGEFDFAVIEGKRKSVKLGFRRKGRLGAFLDL
jgi:hypothetical protein